MEKIIFLVSKEDKELLIEHAKSYRISLSAYIRSVLFMKKQ